MGNRRRTKTSSQVRRRDGNRKHTKPPSQGYAIHNRDPVMMPLAHLWLEKFRRDYEKGDRTALLRALDLWLSSFRGPPAWIANAFFEAITKWLSYQAPTLDAAFGVRRTTKQNKARREREAMRFRVMVRIAQLAQRGHPIDGKLFADVGEEINRSASYVSRIHYASDSVSWQELFKNLSISDKSENQ